MMFPNKKFLRTKRAQNISENPKGTDKQSKLEPKKSGYKLPNDHN